MSVGLEFLHREVRHGGHRKRGSIHPLLALQDPDLLHDFFEMQRRRRSSAIPEDIEAFQGARASARRQTMTFYGSRLEALPLTGLDGADDLADVHSLLEGEEEEDDEPWYKDPRKTFKILLPHISLLFLLLSYTALGAFVLQRMETEYELKLRRARIMHIEKRYQYIVNETWKLRVDLPMTLDIKDVPASFKRDIYNLLVDLSKEHDGIQFSLDVEDIKTHWTFPAAVLYALTVLTTCGYDHVGPMTKGGKLFAVAFALIGIPLMFITAADIGKFLSDTLIFAWKKLKAGCHFCQHKLAWYCCRVKGASRGHVVMDGTGEEDDYDEDNVGLWFPIGAYISVMCFYCSMGGVMYITWEGWDFVHAFHFSFNLITTVGLGGIVVTNYFYMCMIVAYVIIGLAVVTMCVDLASTHLKAYFTKIHYFGRARSHFIGMSEDIREMMGLIQAMRKKKGGNVTWSDVKDYLKYNNELTTRPFTPRQCHLLRYIDETSSMASGMLLRTASFTSSDFVTTSILSNRHLRRVGSRASRSSRSTLKTEQIIPNSHSAQTLNHQHTSSSTAPAPPLPTLVFNR